MNDMGDGSLTGLPDVLAIDGIDPATSDGILAPFDHVED
jgi:hypothetical protein